MDLWRTLVEAQGWGDNPKHLVGLGLLDPLSGGVRGLSVPRDIHTPPRGGGVNDVRPHLTHVVNNARRPHRRGVHVVPLDLLAHGVCVWERG